MTSYTAAAEYLGKKSDRPLSGRSSRLIRRAEDRIAVRYHDTDVVTYHADGRIVLDSGGYQTSTTKARIAEYAPIRIWQTRGLWYLSSGPKNQTVLFADGVTLFEDGIITGGKSVEAAESAKRKLDRWVSAYVRKFAARVEAGDFPEPGPGDCLMCQLELARLMGQPSRFQTGTLTPAGHTDTTGRKDAMGIDHLLSHIAEDYFVPGLLACAFAARHYGGGPGIGWAMAVKGRRPEWVRRDLGKYLRDYKPQLLVAVEAGWTPEAEREAL